MSIRYKCIESLPLKKDGHYHILVSSVPFGANMLKSEIDFVFDTGAFITVITKETAGFFGFDKLEILDKDIELSGYVGKCLANKVRIPSLTFGGWTQENVPALIPQADTSMNILGLNAIAHFSYLINSGNEKIYFEKQDSYKLDQRLMCEKIFQVLSIETDISCEEKVGGNCDE